MNDMETLDSPDGIAIIGMTCRFPGAQNSGMFWKNLCEGAESITFFSDAELLQAGVNPEILKEANYVKAKPILEDQSYFDAAFFEINPREAEMIDPQHRFFLECSWEALENAGYDPQAYRNRIGVYAGADPSQYMRDHLMENRNEMLTLFGNDNSYLCTRISYKLNLKGPSVSVQTACSTSLVAVHMACQSLLDGECDMALAGGVSFNNGFQPQGYWYEKEGIRSPDGHCRAFDAQAKGTVFGSGIGIVVLKRLGDALSDGDHILAVIRGSAINNDGALKIGYTAPSIDGQAAVIIGALDAANVHPETIGYIEAHGTGTLLGDPIEITALSNAFRRVTDKRGFCAIGSVKTNVGHLSAAAGVAGLIKTVLCLKNKKLVPSLHFTEPNPALHLRESPFYVNTELREWKSNGHPRRAGVSSFGIGGTNAHVIVEEAPKAVPADPGKAEHLILLSAKTEEALIQASENFIHFFKQHPEAILADSAYTLQVGRRTFEHRRMLVCNSIANAVSALETNDPERVRSSYEKARHRPLYFMFPGQGSQYANMGHSLYENESLFRSEVDRCAEILQPRLGLDLRQVLYPVPGTESESGKRLEQTALTQPALFVIEYALAKLWMSWGLKPEGMIGHSIGEYVAACLAEVFTLEEALALVAQRGRLLQSLPRGSMLGLPMAEAELRAYIKEPLSIAAVNGPKFCTVSGPDEAIAELESQLTRKDIPCRRLRTSHAFHSVMVEPILEEFTTHVKTVKLKPSRIPFISNVTGTWITTEEAVDPGYWAKHMRQTVRFGEGINLLLKEPDAVLLETGPGRTLSVFAKQGPARTVLNSLPHPEDKTGDRAFLLQALGRLWLAGFKVDWQGFYGEERRRRLPLPTYPFARDRYWVEPSRQPAQAKPKTAFPKNPNTADWFYIPHWKPANIPHPVADQKVWLIFGQDPQLTKRLKALGHTVYTVQPGAGFGIGEDRENDFIHPQQPEEYDRLLQALDRDPQRIVYLAGKDFDMYGLIFLAQALGRKPLTNIRLDVITNHGQGVIQRDTVDPLQAMVLGPALVISQEYPGLVCHVIDLFAANRQQIDRLYDHLLAELTAEPEEKIAAYRGSQRWVRRFEAIPPFGDVSRSLRKNGVYLLTGGFGKIGRTLARHLARDFQAKLVLISRSGLPPRTAWEHWLLTHEVTDATAAKIRFIQELEEQGAEVLVQAADVAVSDQMQTVIKRTLERFDVLHGVLHLAGIIGNESFKLIQEVTKETCETQFRPKVQGTLVLAEVLQGLPLDFCMLFSSLASVLGGLGLGVYAAANCFMDGIAQQQNRLGSVPWFCMNWDSWRFKNGSADEDPEAGIVESAMTPEEGIQAFKQALDFDQGLNQIFISTHDLNRRMETWVGPGAMVRDLPRSAAQQYSRPHLQNPYIAPENEIEQRLVEIWQEVLGIERIGVMDNFFELGGHSLLATQVISRLRKTFGVETPMRALFAEPTITGWTKHVEGALKQEASLQTPAIRPVNRSESLALSFGQERLWFLDQLEPGSSIYNLPGAWRITGRLNLEALERSLSEIARRHETLRTTFRMHNGLGEQVIASEWQGKLSIIDLRAREESGREEAVQRLVQEEAQRSFNLSQGPLLRACVLIVGDQDYVFVLNMHHIISDGWSTRILLRELSTLYKAYCKGEDSPLAEPPVQYADFAAWQRAWLQGEGLEAQLAYWKGQLAGAPAILDLPTDRPRASLQTHRGKRLGLDLPETLSADLRRLSREQESSLFMVLLAAFKLLLYRVSGQTDIVVGTPIAGRNRLEIEGLIGFFLNTLALRTNLADAATFGEVLERVRETTLEAYAHQDVPFEKLLEELQPERDLSRTPLFQVFFNMLNLLDSEMELPGLGIQPMALAESDSKFDLALYVSEQETHIHFHLIYDVDLFEEETMAWLLQCFKTLLESIITGPEQHISTLVLIDKKDGVRFAKPRKQIGMGRGFMEFSEKEIEQSLAARFEEQARRYAERTAVKGRKKTLTYTELNRAAEGVARAIIKHCGAQAGRVALLCDHDVEAVVAILGALKAGKTYVPLDPHAPRERSSFVLRDAQVEMILTHSDRRLSAESLAGADLKVIDIDQTSFDGVPMPGSAAGPETLAYLLYTSGSTGQPKGVIQNQRNVLHHIRAYTNSLHIGYEDRLTLFSSYGFDAAVMDIFGALLNGAALYPMDIREQGLLDLAEYLRREEITIFHSTPTLFRHFAGTLDGRGHFEHIRLIVMGGEEMFRRDVELYQKYFEPECIFINGLGPTESTLSLQYVMDQQTELLRHAVPVGYPVADTAIVLLDAQGRETAPYGEIAIKSRYVALGYWGRPELTAAVFKTEADGRRVYRMGDMGRQLPDGSIEFIGRRDLQVKIRGYRIEPGEIETRMLEFRGIKEAVVMARETERPAGNDCNAYPERQLAAYLVCEAGATVAMDDLRRFLKEKLPDYMVPSAFVPLETMPLLSNGKVNRKALPKPDMHTLRAMMPAPLARSIDAADWFYAPVWKQSEFPAENTLETTGPWIVFGDRKRLSKILIRRLQENGREVMLVREGRQFKVRKNGYTIRPGFSEDYHALITELHKQGRMPGAIIHLWNLAALGGKALKNPDKSLTCSYYSPLFLAQALGRKKHTQTLNVTFVASHMQKVVEEDMPQPVKAALSGLCRIIPQELPQIRCRSVDIILPQARSQAESQLLEQIINEAENASGDAIIAYRHNQRRVQSYESRPLALGHSMLREGGVYLIIDGPAGLGLDVAKYLFRSRHAKVVLITKTSLPDPGMRESYLQTHEPQDPGSLLIQAVEEWERLDLPGLTLRAEVSNAEQMKAAVRAACRNFGTIHGVIHAAGSEPGQRILLENHSSLNKVLAPGIQGIQVLKSALAGIELDFMLICSPLSSLVGGGLGRGAPAAMAGIMAAFTQAMDKRPNWRTAYWDKEIHAGEHADEAYARVFCKEAAGRELIVSACPLAAVLERSAQITGLEAREIDENLLAHARTSVGGTEEKLALIWKDLLGVDRLKRNDSFFSVGGHSLVAIRLINRVRETFKVDLSVRTSFEAPTIAELAKRIEEAHKEK